MSFNNEFPPSYDTLDFGGRNMENVRPLLDNTDQPPTYLINNTDQPPAYIINNTIQPHTYLKIIKTIAAMVFFTMFILNIIFFSYICYDFNNTKHYSYSLYELSGSFLQIINSSFLVLLAGDKNPHSSRVTFVILILLNLSLFGIGMYYMTENDGKNTVFLSTRNTGVFFVIFIQLSIMAAVLIKLMSIR